MTTPDPLSQLQHSARITWAVTYAATLLVGLGMTLAFQLPAAFTAWMIAAMAAIQVLSHPALPEHLPQKTMGAANRVTIGRAVVSAPLAGLIFAPGLEDWRAFAAVTAAITAFVDNVDGYVARRTGTSSPYGARLDMEVDAVTVLLFAAVVWRLGITGPWILWAGVLRYLWGAAAAVLPWMQRPLPPAIRRKRACAAILWTLVFAMVPGVPDAVGLGLAAAGLAAVTGSFALDFWWLAGRRKLPIPQVSA